MKAFERFTSIRAKLGASIVIAVAVTIGLLYTLIAITLPGRVLAGYTRGGWHDTGAFIRDAWWILLLAAAIAGPTALLLVRILGRGMTQPLRDMARAAQRMARGDYRERVHTRSRDEVGRLAASFNQMASELESMERLRRDLVANVSHELRTPIAAIRAHLENLLEGIEQPDQRTIEIMLRQTERLSRLVEQVLDLSRLESGSMPISPEPVSMRTIADEAIAEVTIARGGAVRNEVPGDLPIVVADRVRIHQVLFNLLDNAVRFTPPGGTVAVVAEPGAGAVRVDVVDGGPGIADDALPLVFERFYRADAARSRSDGGAGLGLAIARTIVEAHGGTIGAERRATGTGMRFWFTLPAGDATASQASEPAAAAATKEEA